MRILRNWNRFVTLGAIFISLLLCGVGFLVISNIKFSTPENIDSIQITIFPASTYTVTPTQSFLGEATPTSDNTNADGIQQGVYVQITGTDGSGLRIRANPGLDAKVNFYGMDNEVFLVQEGPIESDGYTWWFITAPYDTTRSGWSAANFLTIIEQ